MSERTSFVVDERVRVTGTGYVYCGRIGIVVEVKGGKYRVHGEDGLSFGFFPFDALAPEPSPSGADESASFSGPPFRDLTDAADVARLVAAIVRQAGGRVLVAARTLNEVDTVRLQTCKHANGSFELRVTEGPR